jgi:hypothetical protein
LARIGPLTTILGGLLSAGLLPPIQRGAATPPTPVEPSPPRFEEISAAAGIGFRHTNGASAERHLPEIMSSGGLFFDFDNDGWVDLFLVDGGSIGDAAVAARAKHRLYRNRGGGTFDDVTAKSGIGHGPSYGMGACAADYDNDGWIDLFITGVGASTLYHDNGNGTFTDVSAKAGVGAGSFGSFSSEVQNSPGRQVELVLQVAPMSLRRAHSPL